MIRRLILIVAGLGLVLIAKTASAGTLDDVKARGFVQCGVHTGLPGFATVDDSGTWSGFDIDYCRAIAAAVFGDATKVKFTPLNPKERFNALLERKVDLLARNTTWTMQRDTALGLTFAAVNYYDGQGFMVKKSFGVTSALELTGAVICVQAGTTSELNLGSFLASHSMTAKQAVFQTIEEVDAAYDAGSCNVLTADASGLYATRLTLSNPDDNIVLPEVISKEPLGLVVRQGDVTWFNIVKWTCFAILNAEELGVTSGNADDMKSSEDQEVRRLLGVDGTFGEGIGLSNDWAYNIVKQVGNYGEIFDRNIGAGSPLKIARGLNQLWTKGGIQYAPPIR